MLVTSNLKRDFHFPAKFTQIASYNYKSKICNDNKTKEISSKETENEIQYFQVSVMYFLNDATVMRINYSCNGYASLHINVSLHCRTIEKTEKQMRNIIFSL